MQSRIKALERMAEVDTVEEDSQYCFKCVTDEGSTRLFIARWWGAACVCACLWVLRYNPNRAALVQSRIKALERMAEVETVEADLEYCFKCVLSAKTH